MERSIIFTREEGEALPVGKCETQKEAVGTSSNID